ncbi:unnamed protein product [Phytophthora lilii]|uniref:Unnamed protein product n=1 Tax=Phytophthora lilii TaxID=2077276 RepID=A0A9W6XJ03_9STRA|nr:unnamed protein product [Phytophthora lilii]
MKAPSNVYIEGDVMDKHEADHVVAGESASGENHIISDEEKNLDGMDCILRFVRYVVTDDFFLPPHDTSSPHLSIHQRHSFCSTIAANAALIKLEECMESVGVKPSTQKVRSMKGLSQTSKSRAEKTGRPKKSRTAFEVEDFTEPDPMMCRRLADVVSLHFFGWLESLLTKWM